MREEQAHQLCISEIAFRVGPTQKVALVAPPDEIIECLYHIRL